VPGARRFGRDFQSERHASIPDLGRFSASHPVGLDVPPALLARADEVIEWCEESEVQMKLLRRNFLHHSRRCRAA
jgi:hypothetical protein